MDKRSLIGNRGIIGAALVLFVLIAFLPVLRSGFVYDDAQYILLNPHVQAGLTGTSLRSALTSTYAANWHPLTWMSHMLDYRLFAVRPLGHHLTNLALHAASVLILFFLLSRITGCLWRSAFVAALFGLHPLRLESVAWVAERKDVLSTLFWLLAAWAYVRYAERPGFGRYSLVVLFFGLGLMSKPMLVTLPFVLLLLDYWPLRRLNVECGMRNAEFPSTGGDPPARPASSMSKIRGLVIEKVPLLLMSAASCVITYLAQRQGQAVGLAEHYPVWVRIGNAFLSYTAYIGKMLWPRCLAVLYPHPGLGLAAWQAVVSCMFLALVTILVVAGWRKRPYLVVGWLWYVGTLVPVIGLIQVGAQAMADRYTYMPLIGLFIIVAWGIPEFVNGRMGEGGNGGEHEPSAHQPSAILPSSACIAIAALAICTAVQAHYWKDNETLYRRALACTSRNYLMLNNMGLALSDVGKVDEAIRFYRRGLSVAPEFHVLHLNLGQALAEKGQTDAAIDRYRTALRYEPDYADAHNNLGLALYQKGNMVEALREYREALRLDPGNANAHYNLAGALVRRGELEEAADHLRQAMAAKPAFTDAHYNLGGVLLRLQRFDEAEKEFGEVVRLNPRDATAHLRLANLYFGQGRLDDAIVHFTEGLELKPDMTRARNNLAVALYMDGRYAEAWKQVHRLQEAGSPPHPAFVSALASKMPEP